MQAKINDETRAETLGPRRELHSGTRTCVGCARRVEADAVRRELVRIALVPDPDGGYEAHADVGGSSFGRGAWVHARRECLEKAASRGLARSAKGRVRADAGRIAAEIATQAERRSWSLLGSARRSRSLAVGSDAVRAATSEGEPPLVLVATDARAAADLSEVRAAFAAGRALALGDKRALGGALGRDEVGVVAVLDSGIASALRHTLSLAATFGHPLHPHPLHPHPLHRHPLDRHPLHQDDEIGPDTGAGQ